MTPFKLTIGLESPICMTRPIALDALLAYALYRHTADLHIAHNELPLKRTDSLWHASGIRFVGGLIKSPVNFNQSLKNDDLDGKFFKPNRKNGINYKAIDQKRDEYKANLDNYVIYQCKSQTVVFFGYGDAQKVKDLLSSYVFNLGKKHSFGHGKISNIIVEETSVDQSVYHESYGVMRPIPIEHQLSEFYDLENKAVDTERVSYYPPYYTSEQFNTPKAFCFVPSDVNIQVVDDNKVDDFF